MLANSHRFPLFLSIVLFISLCGFLGVRWATDKKTSSAHPSDHAVSTSVSELPAADNPALLSTSPVVGGGQQGQDSGTTATLVRPFVDAKERFVADAERNRPAADPAEHAEWVEEFYVKLHSAESSAVTDETGDAAPGIISGVAQTSWGNPIEGIQVTATPREYFRTNTSVARGSANPEYNTISNAHGFFAFRDLPAGIYMVGVADSGFYSAARIEVRTGVKYVNLVLNPQRYARIRGIVTDTMGGAIEGARITPLVEGIPERVVSNTEGEFDLAVTMERKRGGFPLRVQAPRFRETRYEITESEWTAGSDSLINVVMEPVFESGMVSGSVKDTAGLPAAGEIVRLYSSSLKRNYRATADQGGEYEFAGVEPAEDYQLWVRPVGPYRDFVEANVVVPAGYLRRDIELETLERSYRLSGRILDQNGRPVPGLTLSMHSKAATGQTWPVTSDAYGEIVVENVPEGELVFETLGMPYYSLTGLQVSGSDTEKTVELVINRGRHKLLGKVVGSDGTPVAAPKIVITASQTVGGMQSRSSISTSADADGRFVFTELSAGQHTITVNAPGYEGVRLQPVVGIERELLIKLEKNTT